MVHERRVNGSAETLELRVSGKVLHGNLIMFDKQTGSEWLQETGKSMSGSYRGRRLAALSADEWTQNVRWDVWQKEHPDSQVLFCDHCWNEQ